MAETDHTPSISTSEAEKPTKLDKAVAFPTTRTLTAAEWIAIPNNPRQRDTDRHLLNAVHLRRPSPAHLQVNAAVLPDGSLLKLDGHTRARLWELEPDVAPDFVLAAIYPVGSAAEAAALYHHFDSKAAVDTASDDLSGAFNAAGFVPTSPFFRAYKGNAAIKTATMYMMGAGVSGGLDIYKVVPKWLAELRMIDTLGITAQRFNQSIMAAALLTVRRRGERAIAVLDRYQKDLGVKTGQEMDGVEALTRVLMAGSSSGRPAVQTQAGRTISCIEAAIAGRMMVKAATAVSIPRYCLGMKGEMEDFADLHDDARKEINARLRAKTALRKLAANAPPLPFLH